MKKIWIVLLAFGGAVTAAPTADLLSPDYTGGSTKAYFSIDEDNGYVDLITTGNGTIMYDFSDSGVEGYTSFDNINFALTFSIELADPAANQPTICAGGGNTASGLTVLTTNNNAITLARGTSPLTVKDETGEVTTSGLSVDASHTYMLLFGRLSSDDTVISASDISTNIAYLFDLTAQRYIYAENLTGCTATLTNDSSKVWTNSQKEHIRLGNVYLIDGLTRSELVQRAIPEPATATLSLLALAGLAARRRRK